MRERDPHRLVRGTRLEQVDRMRAAVIAALLATSVAPSLARAEPPGLVIPVPVAEPVFVRPIAMTVVETPGEPKSYRWQMLSVDAAAIASIGIAFDRHSHDWLELGVGSYVVGAPIIHAANGHGMRALGSIVLRVTLPVLGGFAGAGLDKPQCGDTISGAPADFCDGTFPGPNLQKGVALGVLAAIVIDTWLVARPERQRPRRSWSPTAAALHGGASVGVAGAF
jgi:hypothetical protein